MNRTSTTILLVATLFLSAPALAQPALAPTIPASDAFTGAIYGQVLTADRQPAAFVTVTLKGTGRATAAGEDGRFSFRNLREGNYTLIITMAGLAPLEQSATVTASGTVSLAIVLPTDALQLAEITVTSGRPLNDRSIAIGKVSIHPMDLPQSLAVIGAGTLRDQQVQRLGDAIRNVNGVYVTTSRGAVQESFGARGYAFGSTNLFRNGTRINSGSMPETGSLERVEVLKGSAAILFGQVAPGGIVNLVSRQPKFNRGGEFAFRAGSFALCKPSFDLYGPLSKTVAARVNGSFESAGSFRQGVSSERYAVNPSFLVRIGKGTELLVEGDYLKHAFTPDFGIGSIGNTQIAPLPRNRFLGTPWQYNLTQQGGASTTLRQSLHGSWKLNASAAYQYYSRDYFSTERIQAAANGDWVRPLGRVDLEERYATVQANLTGTIRTASIGHTLLAGADADRTATKNIDFSFPAVTGLPASSYDKINILDPSKYAARTDMPVATRVRRRIAPSARYGVYVQDLARITDKLNLLAGIRWTTVDTKGIDSTNLLTGAVRTGPDRSDVAFSPRAGLVYKPTSSTSLFASFANSFTVNTGQDVYGRSLAPSIINQFELGVKNDLFGGALSANVTLYRIVNNNLAQTAPFASDGVTPNNNTSIKQLTGQVTSDGIEIDLAAQPVTGLDIRGGYSYNDARYTKTDTTIGSFKTGERLVNNPAHTANASAFFTVRKGALKGVKLGMAGFYTGKRNAGWNNTVGQVQAYDRLIAVSGYATLDLSAGYSWKKISLLARLSNVTNTLNYLVHENYSVNPVPPRQALATVSYKF
ncbi:MAG: TonB-dependent receptor [Flaviaesturariibacter sp.]|nr:TonB-dependent receptor [Flaviaesturariibacter sp.]